MIKAIKLVDWPKNTRSIIKADVIAEIIPIKQFCKFLKTMKPIKTIVASIKNEAVEVFM